MSDLSEATRVRVRIGRPWPGPGHSVPPAGVRLTEEWQEVSGETGRALKDALPHTILAEEDVEIEVLDGGTSTLQEVVGQSTAENLAAEGIETLEDAQAASDETLDAVKGVGSATIDKIRSA